MTVEANLHQQRQRSLFRVRRLAWWLDDAWRLPMVNVRVGADSIIGLVPVAGDVLAAVLSGTVILEALRLRAPRSVLARMAANLAVDFGVGMIPVAGDLFDVFWKANRRNLAVLEGWLAAETGEAQGAGEQPAG